MKKPKHTGYDAPYLDEEEREFFETLDPAGIKTGKTRAEAMAEWQVIIRQTQREKPVTVRVQERDIAKLKARAMRKGIPYQTLIASILHQYAEGSLKEDA